jgi:predicted transcriptional regulator
MADAATLTIALPPETARRLAELAAEEGGSPEALAAEAVAEMVKLAFDDGPARLKLSPEELRTSVEAQMREIEDGTAILIPHEEVMAEMRAKIAAARAEKP